MGFIHYKVLAPPVELLKSFKDNEIDWNTFEEQYNEYIKSGAPNIAIQTLEDLVKAGKDVVIVCFEKSNINCHRRCCSDELINRGLECIEYL